MDPKITSGYKRSVPFEKLGKETEPTNNDATKDLAKQLETQQSRYRALIKSIGDGLIVTDEHARIVSINPVTSKMLGLREDMLVGEWYPKAAQLFYNDGKEVDPEDSTVLQAISEAKTIQSSEFYMRRKDSELFPVSITASPFLIDELPVGVVVVFRDITRERELERAKDEFVSLASHQLRTPATAVKQYVAMVIEGYAGKLLPEQKNFLEKAYRSNERQIEVIEDLLNVSRLDLGKAVLEVKTTDVNAIVKDIIDTYQPVINTRKQKMDFKFDTDATSECDDKKIKVAIENIIDNASKYTPDGGKINVETQAKGENVVVRVSDSGIGIAKEDIRKLFKKFSRLESDLSASRGGTGLGLYMVQRILDLHKGKVYIEPTSGKGATFVIELPKTYKGNQANAQIANS